MSGRKQVKIADLTPTTKGDLSLTFEVAEILEKSQGGDQMTCKIVDETGVINAYFDQYVKFIVEGSVYEIINFRCKVVNHYLRLQMIKNTELAKKPLKVGFKDFENDLSKNFYVQANKEKKIEKKQQNQQKSVKQETIKASKTQQKKQEPRKAPQINQKKQQKKYQRNNDNDERQQKRNTKYTQKKKEREQQTPQQYDQQRSTKKKYVPKVNETKQSKFREQKHYEKEQEGQKRENKNRKIYPKEGEEIKLEKMNLYNRKKMTFVVKVLKDTKIQKEQYFMCKVADSSGATFFQFDGKFINSIQNGWYRLSNFTVYADKVYGFIAAQQKYFCIDQDKANLSIWRDRVKQLRRCCLSDSVFILAWVLNHIIFEQMGVPGFYSWLSKRYPMIKHMISKESLPQIDYLYLDMNGIIYKCVRDDSIIFKAQLMPKELQEIWIEVFNYINLIVDILKPTKGIVLALDGVAPRCKMNNQRSRRFRSARDYKEYLKQFYGYTDLADSQENFKNNSISPGTRFMQQLNDKLHFFLQKKIEEDNYWKRLSIFFTGSDSPGEGEHKIMEFIRANQEKFIPDDTHCFYGADADLIMLGLTLPIKNACIIREQYIHASDKVKIMNSRVEKQVKFELIYLSILRECFDLEYKELSEQMKIPYDIASITRDFVFLFFFIGNDFLPRIYAYNIREKSIEKLIQGFKNYLVLTESYIAGKELSLQALSILLNQVGKFEEQFFNDKHLQFEKFISREEKTFEDEMQQLFLSRLKHEEQTLLGLKQMYANLDGSGRTQYYNSYFKIDPNSDVNSLGNILGYYVYGLKFVYQYYFQNLASWSWYYPYYFAPLLTDLNLYLANILQAGHSLQAFDLGAPFEPFKQLLCILPKESADLLPSNFQKYILEQDSILRNPVDFYPDEAETVTYGSIRSHQAILLIPFLDQSVVCKVYDEEIGKTAQDDLACNVNRLSKLYEYDYKAEGVEVKSPFNSISSFKSKTIIKDVDLKSQLDWRSRSNQAPISEGDEKLLKMPTLYMRPFQFKQISRESEMKFQVQVNGQPNQESFKLGDTIFYGYPVEHSGRIQAILTKNKFICVNTFELNNFNRYLRETSYRGYQEIQAAPQRLFELFRAGSLKNMRDRDSFYNFLNIHSSTTFLFIVDTKAFTRNLQGDFVRLYESNFEQSFTILPAELASKDKIYQNTKNNIHFKSVQKEFEQGEEVLIIDEDKTRCGSVGRVVGFTEKGMVKVEVVQNQKYSDSKLSQVVKMLSTKADIFFSLRFSAEVLQIPFDHLLTILGSINIATPKDSKLPPSIDVGLNFMSRRENKIVPNLVRVNFLYDTEKKKSNPFKHLEISYRGLEIAMEYKEKFPEIFKFIQQRHIRLVDQAKQSSNKKIDWEEPIHADNIYKEGTAKCLMKVYKWLVEKQETHMPASSVYSKQVQRKRIERLQEQFIKQKTEREKGQKKKNKNDRRGRVQIIDPNYLFSQRLSRLGSPYLRNRPGTHQIGDIVICITPQFFGHYGAIVGIDDSKYEVLFDEPSFGKNDLSGLCDNLWGYKFQFRDILNLATWPKCFSERRISNISSEKMGWIDNVDYFYPKYDSKPFQDFEDIKVFTSKEENKRFFSHDFLIKIEKIRQELKQVDLDEAFNVVDNHKEEHRYKYSKKVVYIEKEQIEHSSQVAKFLQAEATALASKPVHQTQPDAVKVELKEEAKEIIENKVDSDEGETPQLGEEQDGTDFLG